MMINIKVDSEVMQCEKSFKSNSASISFLKRVKKVHTLHRHLRAGVKPQKKDFYRGGHNYNYRRLLKLWKENFYYELPIRINITHTNN